MRVRFFGSSKCRECMEVFILLNRFSIEYEYIDTMDDDDKTQNFCDDNGVEELPHLQFITDADVILQHIGPLDEEDLIRYLISIDI